MMAGGSKILLPAGQEKILGMARETMTLLFGFQSVEELCCKYTLKSLL